MNKRIQILKVALARMTKVGERLEDIVDWQTGDVTQEPGIGYGMSEKDIGVMKWMLEDLPGNWVIIVPDNYNDIEMKIRSEEFRLWLESRGYGEGHIILVVGSPPMEGDFSDPKWIVHDLIGHGAERKLSKVQIAYGIGSFSWSYRKDIREVWGKIWNLLPDYLKIATDDIDRILDVNVGIILGELKLEDALGTIKRLKAGPKKEDLEKNIKVFFISAESWIREQDWVQVGGNRVSVIYPW